MLLITRIEQQNIFLFRFDYGEKFWVIKHKQFTCHCASEKCRYNKSNILSFVREYYKRTGEPVPSDSPASSGRQSPQSANLNQTSCGGHAENNSEINNKVEQQTQENVDETDKGTAKNSGTKEKDQNEATAPNVSKTGIELDCVGKDTKLEDGPIEVKVSPTITVKLNLTKDNKKESELVSEILGGKKPTVLLEKELPKSPKSEVKPNTPKMDSSTISDETSTPHNTRRPKRLVRKLHEVKDKKGTEKDKSK